jgi:hypothetical protein
LEKKLSRQLSSAIKACRDYSEHAGVEKGSCEPPKIFVAKRYVLGLDAVENIHTSVCAGCRFRLHSNLKEITRVIGKVGGLPGTSVHSLIALYRFLVDLNCFRLAFRAQLKCKRLEKGSNFFLEHDVSHGSVVGHETVLV